MHLLGVLPTVSSAPDFDNYVDADHCTGRTVIPKSKTESRIKANLEGDFKLDADDLKKIESIDKKFRFNDPSGTFGWDFYTDLDGKQ